MSTSRTMARIGTALAVTLGLGLTLAAPASAVTRYVYEGDDYALHRDNDGFLGVCDMERDGNAVYGVFEIPGSQSQTVRDGNGSAAGCGNNYNYSVTRFKVCEELVGPDWCSGWRYT